MKKIIITLTLILLIVPLLSATDITLKFLPSSSPQSFTVYKGSYVDIPIKITNQDSVSMTCTTTSQIGSKTTDLLQSGYQQTLYIRYTAPNKIQNLQALSITFTTSCNGPAPYSCGFLWTDTCRYVSTPFTHSVSISYALSPQDAANRAILENYRQTLSNKITSSDSNLKTLKVLIDSTPKFLQPTNTPETYTGLKNSFDTINSKFNTAIAYLEQESYSSISSYNSPSSELNTLSSMDSSVSTITSGINSNIQTYKNLVSNFNSEVTKSRESIQPYSNKANSDLVSQYDKLTADLKNKLESYQFSSLSEVQVSIENYKTNYADILAQMKSRETVVLKEGVSIFKKDMQNICEIKSDCAIKNIFDENSVNLQVLCSDFSKANSESNEFNQPIYEKYKQILIASSYNPALINQHEQIILVDSINKNLSLAIKSIEKEVLVSLSSANNLGKFLNVTNYTLRVQEYNRADLPTRIRFISELSKERDIILNEKQVLLENQPNGFFSFFKKIYYSLLGTKQKVDTLEESTLDKPIELTEQFNSFYSNSCSSLGLGAVSANAPNIVVSAQTSNIQTNPNAPEKTCYDENGQRTTNCCGDDSFRSRTDLYPVIFIHGHASENGAKIVQGSLATFNTMQSYFSQNGYIVKDILYPEKTTELTKGIWSYCKPVAVRITYYEGISTGTAIQYKNSIADYSPILSREIDAILTATNKDRAVIVSHSMGGVLSRYYIKNNGGSSKINKLITISSPHYGVRDSLDLAASFVGLFKQYESTEMKSGSPFLNALNFPSDSLINSYTLIGGVPGACSRDECDGVVHVTDAKLNGARENTIFSGSQYEHNSIVNQPDVAQKVLSIIGQ
ncbi:MAG: hypothetical protein Q8L27_03485 [archaeon]|nr:hypothetical protein [archaeon]